MPNTRCTPLLLLALALALAPSAAALPWHAEGWPNRAVVHHDGGGSPGVDVAAVRIRHGGAAAAGALRIFDEDANAVPYLVTYHHPGRDTLISFRAPDAGRKYAIYFGNSNAEPDPMRATESIMPGAGAGAGAGPPNAGPGAGGWVPKSGLVLTTMRRPVPEDLTDNPRSVADMKRLIESSPGLDGAGYRHNISDSLNPFGDSDYFISVYRGWIKLPDAGKYSFCTASNEASFSFMNGKELVHWPGRHTEERGRHGQKSKAHELDAGLHHVSYYHEDVLLYQLAFLGYQPPGAEHHLGIPDVLFPQPHRAVVDRYELAGGTRALALRPELMDSVQPEGRPDGQYTRYRFLADAGSDAINFDAWRIEWSFGDGRRATGHDVQHLYLLNGDYEVQMTAVGPSGQSIQQRWPLVVHHIDQLGGPYRDGDLNAYRPIVSQYDQAALRTDALAELARFHESLGDLKEAMKAVQTVWQRQDAAHRDLADAHRIAADDAASSGEPQRYEQQRLHLEQAVALEPRPRAKMQLRARLIRVVGMHLAQLDAAEQHYEAAKTALKTESLSGRFQAAFRDASIAIGDARLQADDLEGSRRAYGVAESLSDPVVPPPVRAAKRGQWHEAIVQRVENNQLDEALAIAESWRHTLPSDQLDADVLFWIGRIHAKNNAWSDALPALTGAVRVGQGRAYEAEARWLLAEALGQTGDAEARRAALGELKNTRLDSPFRQMAVEALETEK